tara:strand:+ start:1149 stop:1640 length:492 start_codon:yes stop_codon:yes gene_type:complete
MLIVIGLLPASSTGEEPATSVQRVSVEDVHRSVVLIGRLGHPLGTMVTVEGTWGYPDQTKGPTKDYSLQFTIHTVNEKRLARTLTLKTGAVHVIDQHGADLVPPHKRHAELDGVSWSLRAYETGRHTVEPDEYWRYRGPIAMIPQPAFASSIVGFIANKSGEP